MDFTRSVENVQLYQSRAWTHAVLRASEGSVKTNGRRSPQEERQKKHASSTRLTHGRVRIDRDDALEALRRSAVL